MTDKARDTSGEGPLAGIRVLELGRLIAAPLASQVIADLGAEVIKVERPGEGDDFRRYGTVRLRDGDGRETAESAMYTSVNRNKRSITANLAHSDGARLVAELAGQCDVVIENFMVGALSRFGLDSATLRARNPRLIYLSVTGFGQTGPYASRPGTDSAFQAMSGLMSVTGEPEGEPTRAGNLPADYTGGLYGAISILAALRHRDQTGEGQYIDLSLLDCAIASLGPRSCEYLNGGEVPGRLGNRTPGTAPGQLFLCSDGYLSVQAGSDKLFAILCEVLDRPDMAADPRYATMPLRLENIAPLTEELEAIFLTGTIQHWFDKLGSAGLITAPIYDVGQCFDDPHVRSRGMRVSVAHPIGVDVDLVASPMRFSNLSSGPPKPPPTLGQHTEEILGDWLGYGSTRIEQLRSEGAI